MNDSRIEKRRQSRKEPGEVDEEEHEEEHPVTERKNAVAFPGICNRVIIQANAEAHPMRNSTEAVVFTESISTGHRSFTAISR